MAAILLFLIVLFLLLVGVIVVAFQRASAHAQKTDRAPRPPVRH